MRAIVRRSAGQASAVITVGPVSLDTRQMRVSVDGAPVTLTPLEFRLLSYLMHHAGRVVPQIELTEHLYAQDFERDSNAIEVLVGRVRRKLGVESHRNPARLRLRRRRMRAVTRNSLRLRLLLTAALAIAVALIVAGFGLVALFDRHVERRIDAELETYLRQLAGGVSFDANGAVRVARPVADPRFNEPFSGLYWQIEDTARGEVHGSRSLWDARLPLPVDPLPSGTVHRHQIEGPGASTLLVRERQVSYPTAEGARSLRLVIALDRRDLLDAREAFAGDVVPGLAVLALVLLTAVWLQVGIGLKPLDAVRRGVHAVRSGEQRRLTQRYPEEVMPLVAEVNDLLAAQDDAVARARARAADLAHGLKTPLTVLTADAARLREIGETAIAAELELAGRSDAPTPRSRTQPSPDRRADTRGAEATPVRDIAEGVVATLKRTPGGERLTWTIAIAEDLTVAADADDLTEVLGNLLENAAKWARRAVRVAAAAGTDVRLTVEDDGPGVPDNKLPLLGQRGVRLDEGVQGTGYGLAIVGDIVSACGGQLTLGNLPSGGFRAAITLPHG